jgi:hypothetical protein
MRARIALLPLLALACGCAPTYHRPPALRFDRPRAEALEAHAEATCRAKVGPEGVPRRRFVTDGCTLWADGWWTGLSWQACCVEHDIAYWCGGPSDLRERADDELSRCVKKAYSGWLGAVMKVGTCALAGPYVPAHWRWGYGHGYPAVE